MEETIYFGGRLPTSKGFQPRKFDELNNETFAEGYEEAITLVLDQAEVLAEQWSGKQ